MAPRAERAVARPYHDSDSDSSEEPADAKQFDQETLDAEDEAERLLSVDTPPRHNNGRRTSRRQGDMHGRWRGHSSSDNNEKVEEGTRSSDESANASDIDPLEQSASPSKVWSSSKAYTSTALYLVIFVAFVALAYGAYRASQMIIITFPSGPTFAAQTLSNGTHDWLPTTILISLDGFRADFLHRGLTPTLSSFVKQGVSPKYMMPSFPSLTFPNHYTLVTGKYPSEHGIVGNNFYDPVMQKQFSYSDPKLSMVPEYWNAEPLWETAELQGIRTAIHMWPGSEAHIGTAEPTYVDRYNAHEKLSNKVNRILSWLDLPGPSDSDASDAQPRPQLVAFYVPNVDSDGHKYGPNSTYVRSTIAEVDGMLGSLFSGLEQRNLTKIVNVVVVSDHGMASTATERVIQLEDLLDTKEIEHTDGWPLYGLRPFNKSEAKLKELYRGLKAKEAKHKGKFQVYLRDENMPERYHFTGNPRIAPLWIVPEVGWAIAPKHEFDVKAALKSGEVYSPRGLHGYDNDHPLMRAIFVARGPAFAHPEGSMVEPFYNTAVYGIICQTLGITPRSNNGTVGLPFVTTGQHDFEASDEALEDPPISHVNADVNKPTATEEVPSSTPDSSADETDTQKGESDEDSRPGDENTSWRHWIDGKIDGIKHWVTGIFGEHKKATSNSSR